MLPIGQGALIVILVGLLGVLAVVDPKLQGARDVNTITSEEPKPGERFASRIGGAFLIFVGLFLLFLVAYISLGFGF